MATLRTETERAYHREYMRKWRARNPGYDKRQRRNRNTPATWRKWKHGLSQEQYEEMLTRQGGRCAICDEETTLVVDHCHKQEKVRGLLCQPCNAGIGMLREERKRFEKAIEYLESWQM